MWAGCPLLVAHLPVYLSVLGIPLVTVTAANTLVVLDLILPNGGTPAGTSSPASSSSLLNRLQLDDDIDGETRDLFVIVDDPKKHVCTMETYITYRITTKSTRVEFDLPEYSVRRRYQDFDWLRSKLEESQPTHLIPVGKSHCLFVAHTMHQGAALLAAGAYEVGTGSSKPLPEKFVVKGVVDRFSEEFVETRRKALDKFLKRITDHPVLSFNEHFNVFLTAKDLNAYKKQGIALLTRMGESVKHVTGGYKLRTRPLEFAAIGDYLDTFALKLGTIDRIAQRIIKEEIEYLVELREYGPVYSTWSALEGELAEPLEGVSACIGNCSTALEELTDDMTEDFLPVLREYILYSDSMKPCILASLFHKALKLKNLSVLKKRDQVQAEYEAKLEAVALRKEDRPKVPADVEKCQDRMECFNADLKADMERWQNNKRQDFRQLLMGMADKNIQYYEKCLMAWESIIPLLQEKQEAKHLSLAEINRHDLEIMVTVERLVPFGILLILEDIVSAATNHVETKNSIDDSGIKYYS
ncbi:Sorting nexin-30 [Macaca fascicularis]|uniref:Sorting nexin-30 n=1 Tax=Macaca fascicularis TaxID=9541 RepID=G7PRN3_MACFA|nr:Sorting nexin-30 [Macaca fascicularis]